MKNKNQLILRKGNLELRMFEGNSESKVLQKIGKARALAFKKISSIEHYC